jgi:hypothetical protein
MPSGLFAKQRERNARLPAGELERRRREAEAERVREPDPLAPPHDHDSAFQGGEGGSWSNWGRFGSQPGCLRNLLFRKLQHKNLRLGFISKLRLYRATPPVRSGRPPLTPKPYHYRLHSTRPRPGTATLQHPTPGARDPNPGSGNHGMSRLPAFAYLDDAPIHGLADMRLAYSQRILGVAPSPLALAQAGTATHPTTRDSNLGNGNHDMSSLSCDICICMSEPRAMSPSTALPTYLHAASQRILGVVLPPLARRPADQTHTTPQLRLYQHPCGGKTTRVRACTCISWRLSSDGAHLHARRSLRYTASSGYWVLGVTPCPSLPSRPHTHTHMATPTACNSNPDSGNHDMSRLSTFAYLNDVRPSARCRHTSTPALNGY